MIPAFRIGGSGRAATAAVWLAVLAALSLAGCRPAEQVPAPGEERMSVEAEASVDRAVATTGDLITYRVKVDHEAGLEVEIPDPGAEIAGFRIVDLEREEPTERRGRMIEERWYRLRADLVGSYVLPPVVVSYRPAAEVVEGEEAGESADGEEWQRLETSAIFVEVESVLAAAGDADDIRDLKPLRRVRGPIPWLWISLAAGALLLLGAGLYLLRRHRRKLSEVPPIPPHEAAFAALRNLRGTDFTDPEALRRFHFAISEAIRTYVEGRFALNASDLTSEEIQARLPRLEELPADQAESLMRFLLATDRVKFADHQPVEPEIEATFEGALSFVEETRPVPEEQEAAA